MSTLRGISVAIAVGAGAALIYLLSRTRRKVGMMDSLPPESSIMKLLCSRGVTGSRTVFI